MIIKAELEIVVQMDDDVLMRPDHSARCAVGQHQSPRHAKVNDEDLPIVEPQEQIFGAPINGLDPPAGEAA